MLNHAITDARAWTARTIDTPERWHYPLSASVIAACPDTQGAVTAFAPSPEVRTLLAEALAPVRRALTERGFAIVDAPADFANLPLLYWLVGYGLGEPMEQNVQGTLLYDVRDTGQQVAAGARFSVTSYESSFHTDNSFGDQIADVVGLLCLQAARSGGRSQVISGYALHNLLLERHPDVLPTLYEPFHVDRRGGVRAGESATVPYPVIAWADGGLVYRYLRYWIEAGHEKAGQPLTAGQKRALDVLDECARAPELRVEFDLKPGQMFFVNNRWILHNRTAFEDHAEPERRRHLMRLWLRQAPP